MYKTHSITVCLILIFSFAFNAHAQIIYDYANTTAGITAALNTTASTPVLGGTPTPVAGPCGTTYAATNWSTATTYATTRSYVEFDITPQAGYELSVTGVQADVAVDGNGPSLFRYAYSTDGGTTWINSGTPDLNASLGIGCGGTITTPWPAFTTVCYSNTAVPMKFRLYAFDAVSSTGTFFINNFEVLGTVGAATIISSSAPLAGVCTGSNVTLKLTNGSTYAWSPGIAATTSTVTVNPATTSIYTVTGTDINGCAYRDSTTVKVKGATGVLSTTGVTSKCSGACDTLSIALTGTAPWNYTVTDGTNNYSNAAPITTSPTSVIVCPVNASNTTASTLTYTISILSDASGCSAQSTSGSAVVTVNPIPTISLSVLNPSNICKGSSSNITVKSSAAGTTYAWLPTTGLAFKTGASNSAKPQVTTTYTITGTTAAGCSGNVTATVTVSQPPSDTIIPAIDSICLYSSATLKADTAGGTAFVAGATYTWAPGGQTTDSITVSPTVTTTYTVTLKAKGNICPATATSIVVVKPQGTLTQKLKSPYTGCGHIANLTPQSGFSSYIWSTGATTQNLTATSNGTYTVELIPAKGCAAYDTAVVNLNVTGIITADNSVGRDTVICGGNQVQLKALSTNVQSYKWSPAGDFNNSTIQNPIYTPPVYKPIDTGTTMLILASTSVPRNDTQKFLILNGNQFLSAPNRVWEETVTVQPNTNYTFRSLGYEITTPATTAEIQLKVNSTALPGADVVLPVTFGSCPGWQVISGTWNSGAATTAVLDIYDLSQIDNGNDFVMDSISFKDPTGTDLVLNGAFDLGNVDFISDYSYGNSLNWEFINVNAGKYAVNYSPQFIHQNYYNCLGTITPLPGLSCSDTIRVTVTQPPPITLQNDTICLGGSAVLNPGIFDHYTWSNGDTTATITAKKSGIYSVVLKKKGYCIATAIDTVYQYPVPPVVISPATDTLCPGFSAQLSASGALMYNWSPAVKSFTGADTANVTVQPAATTTYTVIGMAGRSGGYCRDTTHVTVAIYPQPVVTYSPVNPTICLNKSVTLTASGATTYVWTQNGNTTTAVTDTIKGTTAGKNTLSLIGGVTYSLATCYDTVKTITVTVTPLPTITVTPNPASVCGGLPAILTAHGASTYVWQPGSINGATASVTPAVDTRYTVTGTDNNGCVDTGSVQVNVHAQPIFIAAPNTPTICAGAMDTLIVKNTSGVKTNYIWSPGNIRGDTVYVTPSATTSYTVYGTDANGCKSTGNTSISLYPYVPGSIYDTTIYSGTTAFLYASIANDTPYRWYPYTALTDTTAYNPLANGLQQSITYTVTHKNQYGCVMADTFTVIVIPDCDKIIVPTAFSPNGDGVNDRLTVISTRAKEQIQDFKIFNRWGQMVFESTNLMESWDGTYDGYPEPIGSYVYYLKYTCQGISSEAKGNITLLR